MASTGTRLRLASNSPLIRCRLPGPQLPPHTASSPVSAASAAAANAAASSCRTCSQVMPPSRRSTSVNPFTESSGVSAPVSVEGRAELTASRARIVAAADAARRRIERSGTCTMPPSSGWSPSPRG